MAGHEFQNDKPRELGFVGATPPISRVSPQISQRALSTYRGAPVDLSNPNLTPEQRQEAEAQINLRAVRRQSEFHQISFPVTTVPQLALPLSQRTYLMIQNTHATANLWIGFGVAPDFAASIGVKLAAGSAYEPFQVPNNDVWLQADAACVATIIYAN